jgi:hypothetical protein
MNYYTIFKVGAHYPKLALTRAKVSIRHFKVV